MHAQVYTNSGVGVKINGIMQLGTHVNQFGFSFSGFFNYAVIQLNLGNTTTVSITNLGKRKNLVENRSSLGAILLFGNENQVIDPIYDGLRQQNSSDYSLGYNFIWYRDNFNTTQLSGGWSFGIQKFKLLFENDIFAGGGNDKFRTGHLLLAYSMPDYEFQTGFQLWTGDTRKSTWHRTPTAKHPYGFALLDDQPYGKTSHGIFYIGVSYPTIAGNNLQAKIGIDDERVRNIFQNRISHDLVGLPKSIKRNTPHYPMLDDEGCPIIEDGRPRKTRFYSQFNVNANWSY